MDHVTAANPRYPTRPKDIHLENLEKKNLRRGSETKSVMSMVLDAAGTDELPQASRRCHCRCRTFLAPNQSQPPRLQVEVPM